MKTETKTSPIKDVIIPLKVVLGENHGCRLEDIAGIGVGTIIELHSFAGEPVDLEASGEKIAKGEVVVIDENYGIRITKILNKGE